MNFIMEQLAKPLLRRAGTALGVYLVGQGVATESADIIVNGVMAGGLVLVDLILSYRNRVRLHGMG